MGTGRGERRAPRPMAIESTRRRSGGASRLGTPLEEAQRSLLSDIARGQWQFFGCDARLATSGTGGISHRR